MFLFLHVSPTALWNKWTCWFLSFYLMICCYTYFKHCSLTDWHVYSVFVRCWDWSLTRNDSSCCYFHPLSFAISLKVRMSLNPLQTSYWASLKPWLKPWEIISLETPFIIATPRCLQQKILFNHYIPLWIKSTCTYKMNKFVAKAFKELLNTSLIQLLI